jgi:hypothetical protein
MQIIFNTNILMHQIIILLFNKIRTSMVLICKWEQWAPVWEHREHLHLTNNILGILWVVARLHKFIL